MTYLNEYVVLDTETTGFSTKWCRIIEICVSQVKDGKIVDTFTTLINPERQIPEHISDLTGITDDMVYDKPKFNEIADKLKEFIGQNCIVGHNIDYDMRFVNAELREKLSNKTIDTLYLSRIQYPGLESYKLEVLGKVFKISDKQLHRAESDVVMTFKLYELLKDKDNQR